MNAIVLLVVFAAGYVGSIYSWGWLKSFVVSVETEIRSLEDRIKALKGQ